MRRVKRSKAKRGFVQLGAIAGAMLVFMNVNAAPLSAQNSPIKTANLKQEEVGLSGDVTNVNTDVNSLTDFEYERKVALLNEQMAVQKKESLLYGDAAQAIRLCSMFYSAADYQALKLPKVQAMTGAHLYLGADETSTVLHTFGEKESVDLLYECEGGNFYYVEYKGTFRGYMKKEAVKASVLSKAQIEQVSLINGSRFVAIPNQDVYLWSEADASSEMLVVVESGVNLSITGVQGDWLQVSIAGTNGYVHIEEVSIARALTAEVDDEGYIKAARAAMETKAQEQKAESSEGQKEVAPGNPVEETTQVDETENGTVEETTMEEQPVEEVVEETTVPEEPVEEVVVEPVQEESVPEENAPNNAPSSVGMAIMNSALGYLGVPYVYGGASPSGFDCSGLVYYCAQLNGVSVPRTADAQYFANGSYVDFEDLAEGDLVFFSADWSSEIEHVGIYVGGGQFVHAPSTGDVVKISDLSGYYSRNYWGALRLS